MLKFTLIVMTALLFSCGAEEGQALEDPVMNKNSINEIALQSSNRNNTSEVETNKKDIAVENTRKSDASNAIKKDQKTSNTSDTLTNAGETITPHMNTEAINSLKASEEPKKAIVQSESEVGLHELFDSVLSEYVSSTGKVDYKGLKSNSKNLDQYLENLQNNPIQNEWSDAKKLAYWINVYNAFTIKLILDNYPLKSIMNLDGGKTWDVKWIKLGSETYSLNTVEHEIIRPQFNDSRIHFAVNCAAKSCPPLYNKAYTEENLDRFLDQRTKEFINNSSYNTINTHNLKISKIFEWYADDFGNLINYLNKYAKTSIARDAKIAYKEYDWSLNE